MPIYQEEKFSPSRLILSKIKQAGWFSNEFLPILQDLKDSGEDVSNRERTIEKVTDEEVKRFLEKISDDEYNKTYQEYLL